MIQSSQLDRSAAIVHRRACPQTFAKKMIQLGHPATRIARLQVVAIIGGVFLTRAVFMVYGYPNNGVDFGTVPTLIRNFGFLLLAVPVLWTILSVWLEERPEGFWTRRWTIITGVVILGILASLLYYSFSYPGSRRVGPIQSVSQSLTPHTHSNQNKANKPDMATANKPLC
ncbi:hypothetical protein ACFQY0_20930 [Haloferula chungangensis]|uniref:Uncharacterized protein n=1 Tax=Haloferula chungangensis TaxID=1048331 RepID=A0ABW2LF76_9BACT